MILCLQKAMVTFIIIVVISTTLPFSQMSNVVMRTVINIIIAFTTINGSLVVVRLET